MSYKCAACGQPTGNPPEFLYEENRWEQVICDDCDHAAIERIDSGFKDEPEQCFCMDPVKMCSKHEDQCTCGWVGMTFNCKKHT